jgi:hypothetical protein
VDEENTVHTIINFFLLEDSLSKDSGLTAEVFAGYFVNHNKGEFPSQNGCLKCENQD